MGYHEHVAVHRAGRASQQLQSTRDLASKGTSPVPNLHSLGKAAAGDIVGEWPLQPGDQHKSAVRGGGKHVVHAGFAQHCDLPRGHLRGPGSACASAKSAHMIPEMQQPLLGANPRAHLDIHQVGAAMVLEKLLIIRILQKVLVGAVLGDCALQVGADAWARGCNGPGRGRPPAWRYHQSCDGVVIHPQVAATPQHLHIRPASE